MLSYNDKKIIKFLEEFKIAKTSTIHQLFYKNTCLRYCQKRLTMLTKDYKEIRRTRTHITDEYVYFINKPKQLKHKLLLTNFISEVSKKIKLLKYRASIKIGNVIPDGLIAYEVDGKQYVACIEVQTRNYEVDIEKYVTLYHSGEYTKYMRNFPIIIAITDRKVKKCEEFKIIKIKEDLSNLGSYW